MSVPFAELLLDHLACYHRPLDSRHWETMLRRTERDIRHDFLYKLIGNHPGVLTSPTPNSLTYVLERSAADARLRKLETKRLEALLELLSPSWWGMKLDDWQARARLSAFLGLASVLDGCLERLTPEAVDELFFTPADAELPETTRRVLLRYEMKRSMLTLSPLRTEVMAPKTVADLALQCDYSLVREGPEAVAKLLASFPKAELGQRCWPEVFQSVEKAPALMEAALKEHRKAVGGRPFFFDLNGPIYALTLIRANQLDKLKKLTFRDSQYPRAMEALKWPARIGEEGGRAAVLQEMQVGLPPGFDALFVALGMFWSFPDELPGRLEEIARRRDAAREAGLTWTADQLAQLLERSQGRSGPPSLVDWGRSQAPWQRALEELAGLKGTSGKEPEGLARLAWEYADGKLEAREQRRLASGEWGGGKTIPLKKLRESAPSYLIEQDHRVLKHTQPGGSRYTTLVLNERAWVDLVGHPHVVDATGALLSVERGESAVEVRRDRDDWVISVTPEFTLNRKIALDEQPGRLVVYEKTAALERLLAIVGSGLVIPPEGTEQLQQALGTVASQVEVRGWKGLGAQKIQADCQPRVLMRPSGPGLRAEVRVRPLGNETAFPPGEGPPRVGNAQVETERDLARERELAATLRPYLQGAEPTAEWSWRTHWLEDSLELLEALRDVPLEWPEGAALKLRAAKEALELRVSTTNEDWFSVQGNLQLDDGRSLSLSKLLELVANARGRFVALGEGEYLALTEELRRQLDDLRAVTDGKKERVHPLAAQALQDLPGDEAWERHKARIAAARAVEPKIPRTLEAELRSYQEDGVRWMLRLAALGAGACLADDMGLGKTVQTIAVLLARSSGGPALVVAPTSVCPNWLDEAARFAPTLVVHQLPARDRAKFLAGLGPRDVLVASYGVLEELGKRRWHTVVLDEAQAIKNASTQRSKSAQKLESDFRVITTGTPVENHLGELWNLFNFLNPGLLGTHQSFQRRFNTDDPAARHRLRRVVGPFLLRRTKSQVLKELPPRTDITLHVELPQEERELYEGLRQDALERLNEQSDPMSVLAGLTRLRRACCHPELVAPGCGLPGAKLTAVLELIEELRDNRHRALVFSQFVDVLQIVRSALESAGVTYQYLDGSTPMPERKARVDAFQGGEGDLFLISLKAGGFGLNLTAADYVIHLDPWWNPAVEDQASDRAHRIGQERPVTVYRVVAQDTVEEKIVALHAHKRELAEHLLEEGSQAAGLSTRELIRLLSE